MLSTLAAPDTVTFPVPKTSGVLGASRFAVPTIVTVPIPSVNGFGLGTSVTASAAIFVQVPILSKLNCYHVIDNGNYDCPQISCEMGNCDIASNPKFINVLKRGQ